MRTTLSSKGQIVLPAELRAADRLEPGQVFEIERIESGDYRLRKATGRSFGVAAWLEACPEKDWFQPVPAESTDSL
ncbi:MAG: AbrB/MazE/SpoVT family DNA-binding domain-containing protein [Pirellulales bacterium]|nr:AbrB/MazE/SpoVT family DNA-binding domain-containing protein [Pirellulales bacterium]MBX3434831.1 AbrB/MazE/SpoVT family DNA-binding domain-containing protein [Pirellulales bacterium]